MPVIRRTVINDQTRLGIWKIDETAEELRSQLALSADEDIYYGTIRNELRKKQWLSYRLVVKDLLGASEAPMYYTEHGKPVLKDHSEYLSVTHTANYSAAIISSSSRVGIDIELLRDRITRVADKFLSQEEQAGIGSEHLIEKLYVIWGAKESLYKLYGKPEVEFKRDIIIDSFDYICEGIGHCHARMHSPEGEAFYDVYYEKTDDYMLVYAISKQKS